MDWAYLRCGIKLLPVSGGAIRRNRCGRGAPRLKRSICVTLHSSVTRQAAAKLRATSDGMVPTALRKLSSLPRCDCVLWREQTGREGLARDLRSVLAWSMQSGLKNSYDSVKAFSETDFYLLSRCASRPYRYKPEI